MKKIITIAILCLMMLNACKEEAKYKYDIVETFVMKKDVVYDYDRNKHFAGYHFEMQREDRDTIYGVSESSLDKNGEYKFKKETCFTESRSEKYYNQITMYISSYEYKIINKYEVID